MVVVAMCSHQRLLLLLLHLVVCFKYSLHYNFSEWAIDDDGCRTPNRGVGQCVVITQCPAIINYILKPTRLTKSEIKILKYYRCGYEKNLIKMCCPNNNVLITKFNTGIEDEPTSTTTTISPLPISIPAFSNHTNINLLPSDCGSAEVQNKIFYGKRARLFEFPWMVLLSYETATGFAFRCGGTIINERYVLTAAHCISNQPKLAGVRIGEHNIQTFEDCTIEEGGPVCAPPVQDIEIEEIIPHPDFNISTLSNDIGLLRLSSPINLSVENTKPICLPTTDLLVNLEFRNRNLIVSGWGITETGLSSDVLLKAAAPTINQESCSMIYRNQSINISSHHLCTGGVNGADSCYGDSGGPLQSPNYLNEDVRFIQFAIVSVGPRSCGRRGYPSINTKIGGYMNWILDTLKP